MLFTVGMQDYVMTNEGDSCKIIQYVFLIVWISEEKGNGKDLYATVAKNGGPGQQVSKKKNCKQKPIFYPWLTYWLSTVIKLLLKLLQ